MIAASVVAVGVIVAGAGAVAGVVLDAAGLLCFSGDGGGLIHQQGLAGAVALGVIAAGAVAGVESMMRPASLAKPGRRRCLGRDCGRPRWCGVRVCSQRPGWCRARCCDQLRQQGRAGIVALVVIVAFLSR